MRPPAVPGGPCIDIELNCSTQYNSWLNIPVIQYNSYGDPQKYYSFIPSPYA